MDIFELILEKEDSDIIWPILTKTESERKEYTIKIWGEIEEKYQEDMDLYYEENEKYEENLKNTEL